MKLAGFDSLSVAPYGGIMDSISGGEGRLLQCSEGCSGSQSEDKTSTHWGAHLGIKAGGEPGAWGEVCGAHHGAGGCHASGHPREDPEVVGTGQSLACGER